MSSLETTSDCFGTPALHFEFIILLLYRLAPPRLEIQAWPIIFTQSWGRRNGFMPLTTLLTTIRILTCLDKTIFFDDKTWRPFFPIILSMFQQYIIKKEKRFWFQPKRTFTSEDSVKSCPGALVSSSFNKYIFGCQRPSSSKMSLLPWNKKLYLNVCLLSFH